MGVQWIKMGEEVKKNNFRVSQYLMEQPWLATYKITL